MSDYLELSSPVYQFPFPDDALVVIARITLMWGQIDSQLDHILMNLYRLDFETFDHLFAGKTVGPKCESAKVALARSRSEDARTKTAAMIEAIIWCIRDRNVVTHGIWGWRWEPENSQWNACAWSRSKQRYFLANDLGAFHNQVVDASVKADAAWHAEIAGEDPPPSRNRLMLFSADSPETLPGMPPRYER